MKMQSESIDQRSFCKLKIYMLLAAIGHAKPFITGLVQMKSALSVDIM